MAKIENMSGTSSVAVAQLKDFFSQSKFGQKQIIRIQISLQGNHRRHLFSSFLHRNLPVDTQCLCSHRTCLVEQSRYSVHIINTWNSDGAQSFTRIGQCKCFKISRAQNSSPSIKELNRICS